MRFNSSAEQRLNHSGGGIVIETGLAGGATTFFQSNHRWAWTVLIVLACAFPHTPVHAYDFQACYSCHTILTEEMTRIYPHTPFIEGQCRECHAAEEVADLLKKEDSGGLEIQKKIEWLGEAYMAETDHGFLLPGEKVGDVLVVQVQGEAGGGSRQEISIPPLAGIGEVEDSGKPPFISDLRMLDVRRGIFLSATIGWRTDTLADARVRYGEKDLSQTSSPGNRLGRRHEVVLNDLKPDTTYSFVAVSRDIFGREHASEPLTFSTSSPLAEPQAVTSHDLPAGHGIIGHFQRAGADYLLVLTLPQPSSAFVGAREVPQKDGSPGDNAHSGLGSKQAASLDACRKCHRKQNTATHPVNVYPKPGMVVPPEYPTLPDGRITCRSCHETHSSNYEYLAIKPGRRELCVGCHRDMI
jgi:predicted CXXCH cytochrome family protein